MPRPKPFYLALAVCLVLPSVAYLDFHFSVRKSAPAVDEVVESSPKKLQIWFSQVPAEGVSQLALAAVVGSEKKAVQIGKTVIDKESRSMTAEIPAAVGAGTYLLQWRGAGDDGHVMSGEVKFSVVPKTGGQ